MSTPKVQTQTTQKSKGKKKWLLPVLILGGVVLLAGAGTGIALGVKNCGNNEDQRTPYQQACDYLKAHPSPFNDCDDWSHEDNNYGQMIDWFKANLSIQQIVNGFVEWSTTFEIGPIMKTRNGKVVRFSVNDVKNDPNSKEIDFMCQCDAAPDSNDNFNYLEMIGVVSWKSQQFSFYGSYGAADTALHPVNVQNADITEVWQAKNDVIPGAVEMRYQPSPDAQAPLIRLCSGDAKRIWDKIPEQNK